VLYTAGWMEVKIQRSEFTFLLRGTIDILILMGKTNFNFGTIYVPDVGIAVSCMLYEAFCTDWALTCFKLFYTFFFFGIALTELNVCGNVEF
jgi:uncharacterized membrane protein